MSLDLNYDELMAENARLSAEKTPGGFSGGLDEYVKLPEGNCSVLLRILPPRLHPTKKDKDGNPAKILYQATRTHRLNGKNLHCRRELVQVNGTGKWMGECPVCEYINWLWTKIKLPYNQSNTQLIERLKAEASALRANERYYYSVIQRKLQMPNGDVKENVGPLIYSCGTQVQQRIIGQICGNEAIDEKGYGNVTDEKNGRDFKVIKRHKGGVDNYPEYTDSKFMDPSPLGDPDKVSKWLEARQELWTYRKLLTVEELEFEVDVHRGKAVDVRKKSRFDDDGPVNTGSAAAAVSQATSDDDDEPPVKSRSYDAPVPTSAAPVVSAPAVAVEESVALDQDDFIKRLQEI